MLAPFRAVLRAAFRWLDRSEVSNSAVTLITAVVVGVGAGLGAVVFRYLLDGVRWLGYGPPVQSWPWWLPLLVVPAIGGLIVGPLVYFWAREARGHGVPEVMEAVALRGGRIRPRVAVVKVLASGICIGTGGSAGREGPIVQIGSAIGSTVGQALNFSDDRIRSLVACGAAGGIAATFNAPIAGAIFAIEVILGRLHTLYFSAVVISAVVADVVAQAFVHEVRAFDVPEYSLASPLELPLYAVLGAFAAVGAVIYSRGLYAVEDLWERLLLPEWVKPALGGLALGALGIATVQSGEFPRIFGVGYESISAALLGQLAMQTTALLLVMKMLATWITLGSGGSGGIFAPSLFMGAMLGRTFGGLANLWFPAITGPPGAYALVGMAAFFSGAAHAPVTSILILFEMTGDYRIILPLMLATVVSTLVSGLLSRESIYTLKLSRRGVHLEQGRDVDVLQTISVGEVMSHEVFSVDASLPVEALAEELARHPGQALPVLREGELFGVASLVDLDGERAGGDGPQRTAADVATRDVVVSHPDESLGSALRRLGVHDVRSFPVVERETGRLLGSVRRDDIVDAYNQALSKRGQLLQQAKDLGLGQGQPENLTLVQIRIGAGSAAAQRSVGDLRLPDDCLIVALRRGKEQRVVRGSTMLLPGDLVTVVAPRSSFPQVRSQLS